MDQSDVEGSVDSLIQSRAGGRVERCHGIPHQGSYNNAAHSWGVAMLMHYLWPEDFPRLALVCLAHDVPEAWVGDVPAPTMRYVPGLKDSLARMEDRLLTSYGLPTESGLSEEDHAKLKACDRLEFYLWCREQEALGNQFASEGRREVERFFQEVPLPRRAREMFDRLLARPHVLPRQAGVIKELCSVS